MAIDISFEQLFPLHKAAPHVPGRPHNSTIWRWGTKGVRGIILETVVIGGRRYTSKEALERFFDATDAVARGGSLTTATSKQQQLAIAQAERETALEGI